IKDAATNAAALTLPATGGAHSIAGQKAIAIDTVAPATSDDVPSAVQNGDRRVTLTATDTGAAGVASTKFKIYTGSTVPLKSDSGWATYAGPDASTTPLRPNSHGTANAAAVAPPAAGNEQSVQR